jgi:hypothetical protein
MDAPKAFISYSHDSVAHKTWVLKLANDLRANGVDVILDQWDLVPGQDITLFMQRGISECARAILVCSGPYVTKAEKGVGGVGYERLIVTAEMVANIDTTKFIPILRGSRNAKKTPLFLGPRLFIDFETDATYNEKLIELVREIHGQPAIRKPPLGPNPFSGTPKISAPTSTTGSLSLDDKFLDNDWFLGEHRKAIGSFNKMSLTGQMELRSGILHPLLKSQIELLAAMKHSEIRTFGWPIGIILENREEFRPRPHADGIKAEVSISERDRTSFDYWALRSSGDFFLLQSLFEDMRRPKAIFVDTRIVRVTECLMFVESLYRNLGIPPEARVCVRISHRGFAGRELSCASPNRIFYSDKTTIESESVSEISVVLGAMKQTRVEDVRRILEPMFMLFDFFELNAKVYEEIVRNFENGKVV